MSKLEDKAVEVIDKSMIGVERLTEKMAELAAQYGPDVVNAGIEVARFTAAGKLLEGIGWGAVAYGGWRLSVFLSSKKDDESFASEVAAPIAAVCTGFGSIASAFAAIWPFFNIWNWIGIVEPRLWIAHRILEKAL